MYTRVKPSYLATNLRDQFVLSIRKKEESGSDIKCRCPATSPTSGTTPTLNQCTALENQVPSKPPRNIHIGPPYSSLSAQTVHLHKQYPNAIPHTQSLPSRTRSNSKPLDLHILTLKYAQHRHSSCTIAYMQQPTIHFLMQE
jgi:hypothetical protein